MTGSSNRWSAATLWLVIACVFFNGQKAVSAPTAQQLPGYQTPRSAQNDANVASYLRYEEHAKHSGVESATQQVERQFSDRPKSVDDNDDVSRRPSSDAAPLGQQPRAPQNGRRQDRDEVYSMVVSMGHHEKSVFISPDVAWLRTLAPRVLTVADETEDLIRETVSRSMESISPRGPALVNIVNSTVHSMDEMEGTLKYLNGIMQPQQADSADQTRSFPPSEEKAVVINVFLFNLLANTSSQEVEEPAYPAEYETYLSTLDDLRKATSSRPLSAMEMAYLPAQTTEAPHYYQQYNAVKLETWVPPFVNDRDVTLAPGLITAAPTPAPAPAQAPVSADKPTGLAGMSNRMKAIGYSAIPVMAGLATTWQFWLPAVAAFGRKKRSVSSLEEKDFEELARSLGRAIDPQWLSILMGQRYSNSSKAELQSTVDNWKNRDKNGTETKTSTARSTTRRSVSIWPQLPTSTLSKAPSSVRTTGTTSRSISTRAASIAEESTPRFDGWKPSSSNTLWYHNNAETYSAKVPGETPPIDGPNGASLHILPISTSSEDFDIVANFVRSTLTKMGETTDPQEQNEVFVFNTPSIVNASVDGAVTSVTEPATAATSAGSTPSSAAPSDSPISAVNVFTGAAGMPVLPDGITNSPVTFVTVTPPSFINLVANSQIEAEGGSLPVATPTSATSTSERSTTTKRSTGEATALTEEEVEYVTLQESDIYDDSDFMMTASTVVEFYDEDTGTTYVAKEIPMPTPAYPDGYENSAGKRPLPDQFYIDPNEIPARVRPTPSSVPPVKTYITTPTTSNPVKSYTTRPSISPVGALPSTSADKISASNLVTIQSFTAASQAPSTAQSVEKVTDTEQANTDATVATTLKFSHGGYVVETTSPPPDSSILVSDVVSTQQMIDGILKVYGTGTMPPATSQQPSTLVTAANEAEYDYYEDTTGIPVASFNLTDFYTTYTPSPEDPDLDILALFNQLQSNLTTGILTPATSSGIHFVNTSTDIILVGPLEGATPASVVDIEPITDSILVTAEPQTPPSAPSLQIDAVVAEDDTAAIIVDAAPSLVGAPAPSVPDVSSNANIFLSSVTSTGSGISINSGTTSTSTTTSASSGVAFAVFAISLAAAAYVGAVLLPVWLPFALKKKRRRNYAPARNSYPAASYSASAQHAQVHPAIAAHNRKNYQEIGSSASPYQKTSFAEDQSASYSDSTYEDLGPLDDFDNYGPDGYHRNHNYDVNKRRAKRLRH